VITVERALPPQDYGNLITGLSFRTVDEKIERIPPGIAARAKAPGGVHVLAFLVSFCTINRIFIKNALFFQECLV
jgi:hypothetical protein